MKDFDLNEIKYYPDRFYMKLDGFNAEQLTSFITDFTMGEQHAIFIHEYYHYLTNIISFAGVRQFNLNFCDRFRLVTILTHKAGLDAFPVATNAIPDCADLIAYWNNVSRMIEEDDLDYDLVKETVQSPSGKFEILCINKMAQDETFVISGQVYTGARVRVQIDVGGLINRHDFELTYGALDEFLNSSIDEYMFEHDIATIKPATLSKRPYYPYHFFDDLLQFYGIVYPSSLEKILLAYYALNSPVPPLALIGVLESLQKGGYDLFQQDMTGYLSARYEWPDMDGILQYTTAFSDQCAGQGRVHIAQALRYYGDRFYIANQLKRQDLFYFVRPFLVQHPEQMQFKQQFLLALARIIQVFTPPLILQSGLFKYIDKLTTMGEATTHIIAAFEIFESLKTKRIAHRPDYLKEKYNFPENNPDCDDITQFTEPPIQGSYRLALNELGLYRLYYEEGLQQKNRSKHNNSFQ